MVKALRVMAAMMLFTASAAAQESPAQRTEQRPTKPSSQQMVMFETVLRQAVQNGAAAMVKQVRQAQPLDLVLSDAPEATGFLMADYGVFFHVRVPGIASPFSFYLRTLAERASRVRQAAGQQSSTPTVRVGNAGGANQAVTQASPAAPFIDADLMSDPDALYTREVKIALIDAMLDQSISLSIAATEYLIVAARDNAPPDPLMPSDRFDFQTVEFRIKGSDLSAFHQGRIGRDDARKLVTIREY